MNYVKLVTHAGVNIIYMCMDFCCIIREIRVYLCKIL